MIREKNGNSDSYRAANCKIVKELKADIISGINTDNMGPVNDRSVFMFIPKKNQVFCSVALVSFLFITGCRDENTQNSTGGSSEGGSSNVACGPDQLIPSAVPVQEQDIAVNAMGDAVAIWVQPSGRHSVAYVNFFTQGVGCGEPQPLIGGIRDPYDPIHTHGARVALDNRGNATAVWFQGDGMESVTWGSHYARGAQWEPEARLGGGAWGSALQVAMDDHGDAAVVWLSEGMNDHSLSRQYYTMGSGWTPIQIGVPPPHYALIANAADPQVFMDSDGNGLAVWRITLPLPAGLYSSRHTARAPSWDLPEWIGP